MIKPIPTLELFARISKTNSVPVESSFAGMYVCTVCRPVSAY